ncbi:hypothetical protein C8R46DRAFT_1205144 [Mycena filopes]|nr:hypothetical protein C8R46DRAFT_1205144 [Mycena filopes]
MGRALFSERYGSKARAAVVRVDPEPVYSNWSVHNAFDPDSDEFFSNAVYEAFVEPGEMDRGEHPVETSSAGSDTEGSPVINTIWDRLVENVAPEAAVQDESMLADIPGYARTTYPHRAVEVDADTVMIHADEDSARPRAVTVSISTSPPIHPPSALRNSTTATDLERASIPAAPHEPSTPSPTSASASPASPRTPPALYAHAHAHVQLMTPSPPPTVSPRIYMWGAPTRVPASPGSPSVRHTHTHAANPLARITSARMTRV